MVVLPRPQPPDKGVIRSSVHYFPGIGLLWVVDCRPNLCVGVSGGVAFIGSHIDLSGYQGHRQAGSY